MFVSEPGINLQVSNAACGVHGVAAEGASAHECEFFLYNNTTENRTVFGLCSLHVEGSKNSIGIEINFIAEYNV